MSTPAHTPVIELLQALAPTLGAGGWDFSLEYPGYLDHTQEEGTDDALQIVLGVEDSHLHVQYNRGKEAERHVAGFAFRLERFETAGQLALFLVMFLDCIEAER